MAEDSKTQIATGMVRGHEICQTSEAKWLYIDNLYDHFQRPNFYDIGGTNINDEADFWFLYKTEQVAKVYVLHLFVCNRNRGSFCISLSDDNELSINYRTNVVSLNAAYFKCNVDYPQEGSYNYLKSYSFTDLDVELMKDKKFLIPVSIDTTPENTMQIPCEYAKGLHDFGQLLSDPVGSDFTIETADGTKFPVHKIFLSARSEVFQAMLTGDTAENMNNYVKIADVGKEDIGCVIEFLYTGTVKNIDNYNCFNLLMLADKYLIKGLKELAQHALSQKLSTDNALETLMAADMYNCENLKTSAMKFIKANIASLESSLFEEIHNIQLLRELCKYLALKY